MSVGTSDSDSQRGLQSQLTYKAWLPTQTMRDDPVGDLARDLLNDRCWDGEPTSVRRHISEEHPTPLEEFVFAALARAMQSYRRALRKIASTPPNREGEPTRLEGIRQ